MPTRARSSSLSKGELLNCGNDPCENSEGERTSIKDSFSVKGSQCSKNSSTEIVFLFMGLKYLIMMIDSSSMGPIEKKIKEKLQVAFEPFELEVTNESSSHHVPEGSESHFKVLLVSNKFEDKSRVERQRVVHDILSEERSGPVHALSMRLVTVSEFEKMGSGPNSPDCRGGSKAL